MPAALSRIGRAGRRGLAIAVLALAVLALAAPSGEAQPRVSGATATRAKTDSKRVSVARGTKTDNAATAPATGPLLAVVSIARQRIQVYGATGLVTQAPVSTGMAGHRTPTGVFSVLQKRRHHHSNIYSNAPMPYMQRLTWSGIALHAGVLPGYPASHGCIRLPYGFAAELWGMTGVGTRVVVAPDDAPAVAIEHPRLPAPRLTPVLLDDERLREEAGPLVTGPTLASAAAQTVVDAGDELGPLGAPRLNPWQRAVAARTLAARTVADTAKAAKQAVEAAKATTAEAGIARAALRRAELGLAAAQRRRDASARAAAAATRPLVAERAARALAAAEDGLAEAQRAAGEAALIEAARSQEAFEAASTAADAEEARRAAVAAVKAAARILEPISIFVSRKAGRVYVRQAWEPVHEAPVTFTDAGPPLGTHVFLATGATADNAGMHWLSVSLPASAPRPQRAKVRRGEPAPSVSSVPAPRLPAATTAGALAGFELPDATRAFIADRLWAGATLIVSDHGASGETGVGTDFIVLSR